MKHTYKVNTLSYNVIRIVLIDHHRGIYYTISNMENITKSSILM